jgi:hypothetical protein
MVKSALRPVVARERTCCSERLVRELIREQLHPWRVLRANSYWEFHCRSSLHRGHDLYETALALVSLLAISGISRLVRLRLPSISYSAGPIRPVPFSCYLEANSNP